MFDHLAPLPRATVLREAGCTKRLCTRTRRSRIGRGCYGKIAQLKNRVTAVTDVAFETPTSGPILTFASRLGGHSYER
ncbi:hypothetical protein V1291_004384 [Nitrobacteraceae bacterium AZCC 1564]